MSAPFFASTVFTVTTISLGSVGAICAIASGAGSGAATGTYVHVLPTTSGSTFAPHAGGVLLTVTAHLPAAAAAAAAGGVFWHRPGGRRDEHEQGGS